MRRIVVTGSPKWRDTKTTNLALTRVIETYQGPYTLIYDPGTAPGRYAAAAARKLGWALEPREVDITKCGPDCAEEHHRRPGGPAGDWCPTARTRDFMDLLETSPDVVFAFNTEPKRTSRRDGHLMAALARGIAVWSYQQKISKKGGSDGNATD